MYSLTDFDDAVRFIENAKEKVRLYIDTCHMAQCKLYANALNSNTYEYLTDTYLRR